MPQRREDLTRALAVARGTGEKKIIEASEIAPDEVRLHEYFCADCAEKGLQVRLQYRPPQNQAATFEKFDRTGGKVTGSDGVPITRQTKTSLTARFNRWPGTPEHQCDNPVRYAALRQIALRLDASQAGEKSFVFPVHVPGRSILNDEVRDIRKSYRPEGMGYNRIETAEDMARLLDVLKKDPGIHLFQKIDDGKSARRFDEFYYERPQKLYNDLLDAEAFGRYRSRLVACVVNPNTSAHALRDPRNKGCVLDRSMEKTPEGDRLHLMVRPMNRGCEDALFKAAHLGSYKKTGLLVLGEASLNGKAQVDIEIFNPAQFMVREDHYRLLPKVKVGQQPQASLL